MAIRVIELKPTKDEMAQAASRHAGTAGKAKEEAGKQAEKTAEDKIKEQTGKIPVVGGMAGGAIGKIGGLAGRFGKSSGDGAGAEAVLHEKIEESAKIAPVLVVYGSASDVEKVTKNLEGAGVNNATVIQVDMNTKDKDMNKAFHAGFDDDLKKADKGSPQIHVYGQGSKYDAQPKSVYNGFEATSDTLKKDIGAGPTASVAGPQMGGMG